MKLVYRFGGGQAEGSAEMKDLLGGKGANLAEMTNLHLPVPAGFTISTGVCVEYLKSGKYPLGLVDEVKAGIEYIEGKMGRRFGDAKAPLLLSCRSGARASMPGMMETVLNIGLCERTLPGLVAWSKNERFAYDAYRRLLTMYADVVMEKAEGKEPPDGKGIRAQLDSLLHELKERTGRKADADLTAEDLKGLCAAYKARIAEVFGKQLPEDPHEQLWNSIRAVFKSWNGKRAVSYRRFEDIPDDWGTAVNVQAMVFGNMGDDSATGVAFTRNSSTGDPKFNGEWLRNAQGEDVVAGIRTPNPLNEASRTELNQKLESLEQAMPEQYTDLYKYQAQLERHFNDMQDIEFTIERDKLWMLQTRNSKRNGLAAVRVAMDLLKDGRIDEREAVLRVRPEHVDELLHPILDPAAEKVATLLGKGLPAGPGGAVGRVVFTAADAVEWSHSKHPEPVILVRAETSPEDIDGMRAAAGILTATGGMTSHAALVARGWGKCCVVGAADVKVDVDAKKFSIGDKTVAEGNWLSQNGTKGRVYEGKLPLVDRSDTPELWEFMKLVGKYCPIVVRANAETQKDAARARNFGAGGIGLFRTEHMFYGEKGKEPMFVLRKMILAKDEKERRAVLGELFGYVKAAIKGTLEVMDGLPVTIRLLDPPLHEFVPKEDDKQAELARRLGVTVGEVKKRAEALHEVNPMMGHRGVRLGITYPEITEMQARAIFEAAAELLAEGKHPEPEIMVPVTCERKELENQNAIIARVHKEVCAARGRERIPHSVGTMIEIPRAALLADQMAGPAEFFSFGTNDLTQMTFGFSRDDANKFLHKYIKDRLLKADPFQTIDQPSVGELIRIGVERGRKARPGMKIGICGEHGGDPESVKFCWRVGMNYVSCSPFRVPVARLAAAQGFIEAEKAKAPAGT